MPTKATEEETRIDPRDAEIAKLRAQLADVRRQGEGWLVTTDSPLYEGTVYGVSFVNGAAFIGVDQHLSYFEVKPETDESIKSRFMHFYTRALSDKDRERAAERIQREIDAQRQREALSTAERAAGVFASMKGYTVERFDADHVAELQERMSERANQQRKAKAALIAKANAEALVPPGFLGQR
jgi:hypothetical protein